MFVESERATCSIREIKAFLEPYRECIHCIVLFGSYAFGRAGKHSDVDFLVILKEKNEPGRLSLILTDYERRIQDAGCPIQLAAFTEKQIEFLFRLSSPLVHSAAAGVVIRDDGYFRGLQSRAFPEWPTKEYAIEAFTRWIAWQYFHSVIHLRREIARDHGPRGLCTRNGSCFGHLSGDILARVISRMLYVTLPARGFMPLFKLQAREMAVRSYGERRRRPILLSMAVLRKDRGISEREFQVLSPFATELFRECLRICGRDERAVAALKRVAVSYRGIG